MLVSSFMIVQVALAERNVYKPVTDVNPRIETAYLALSSGILAHGTNLTLNSCELDALEGMSFLVGTDVFVGSPSHRMDASDLASGALSATYEPMTSEFTCGYSVEYDGHNDATVQIGNQCWFAENLRSTIYANGDVIPGNLSDSEWIWSDVGAQAFYDNNPSNQFAYGRLYNWYAVNDERGLCPSGWHVPTDGVRWSDAVGHV